MAERTQTTIRLQLGQGARPAEHHEITLARAVLRLQDLRARHEAQGQELERERAARRAAEERAQAAEERARVAEAAQAASLATIRAMRRDWRRLQAERDHLRSQVLRLRALAWGTAPLRWWRWLRRLG